jgi:hypothetical protein
MQAVANYSLTISWQCYILYAYFYKTFILIMRLLLILIFFYPFISKAQVSIQGHVTDADSNAVPYATVILKSLPDSILVKGNITDSLGYFQLNVDAPEDKLLQIAAIGYGTQYVLITNGFSTAINLSVALKPDAQTLKWVTVTATKPLIERKPDRMIFNVASSVSAIGSDAFELLKKAPGVRASDNGGISIAGKSTVSIMIDNKLQQVGNDELAAILHSISAENVDRIEVITTPPARYDAQGNSGIINIVTQKSTKNGLNGNLGLTYQQRFRGSKRINDNLNYRNGKVNIYSNGSTNFLDFYSIQKTTVPYGSQLLKQTLDQQNKPFYNRYQLGVDFNYSKNALIGILYTIGNTNRQTNQLYNAPVVSIVNDGIDSILRTVADEREASWRHVVNLNYEWRIDTAGTKLNIDADFFSRKENDHRDFNIQSFTNVGDSVNNPAGKLTTAKQNIDIRSLKADVIWPYKGIEFSFGAKASSIHTYNDNDFYDLLAAEYVLDINKSNHFDYTENTQAVYINAVKKHDKWEGQIGLRLENTQTKGVSYTLSQTITKDYLQLFPTAYVQYLLDDDHVFNLNYSRRVGRPSFEELNPFRVYGTGGSYRTGNPFLQPSFYHTVELAYSLKSKYTFTAYTGIVNNMHARISKVDTANNQFYFTNENAGNSFNMGASAMAVINFCKWWECNLQVQGYYDMITSNFYNSKASVNGIWAYQSELNNTFIFNKAKTLLADAGITYISRFQYDFVVHGSYYAFGAGFKAVFFNKQLTLALSASDILRTEKYNFENIYNGVSEQNYFDARSVNFSLNWKFGNNQIKPKRQRDTDTEETKRSQ